MIRSVWPCALLAACMDIAESNPPGGTGGSAPVGGAVGSGGVAGSAGVGGSAGVAASGGAGGSVAGAGGMGGDSSGGSGGSTTSTPFALGEFASEHSGDSAPNAHSITFAALVPSSTRLLLACVHSRDNDTSFNFYGAMTLGETPMTAIDAPARGVYNGNQAGVQCFYRDDPPTGAQNVKFSLTQSNTYDYLRITTFYFSRPALIHAHSTATHAAGNAHGGSLATSEPAVVLAIHTRYYTTLSTTSGFTELFDEPGFGNDALHYAAYLVQTQPGTANWSVVWGGSSSWGGSQLVAVVPK